MVNVSAVLSPRLSRLLIDVDKDWGGRRITNISTVGASDAARKDYVDGLFSQFKATEASTSADIAVGSSETAILSASASVPPNTLLLAVFNMIYAQGGSSVGLILRLYSDAEVIGGYMAYNAGMTATYNISIIGAKYFSTAAAPTIKATAVDIYARGYPAKAGTQLKIILIPATAF